MTELAIAANETSRKEMRIFLSAVSGQFKQARDALASDLRAVGAEVVVQEDFQQHGHTLLEKLEQYIATCDRVIALVGDGYGWEPDPVMVSGLPRRSYSQWEYFFAQGERLFGQQQRPIDTYVYFASPEFLATHHILQESDAAERQRAFVRQLRQSGKDWNEFSSTNELRALVLRDGFRLPSENREELVQHIGKIFNLKPASAENLRLTPILTKRLRPLLDRHALFGGRNAELDWLDSYLLKHTSGYMFVTARSGFGKTALLANWVKKSIQDKRAICYHFISRIDETASEEFTLRNLCQQLASHHGLTGELPTDKDHLRALYPDLLSLPPQIEQMIIVLDGLDESGGWVPGPDMFPAPLPAGVFVMFSARDIAGRDWLAELGLTGTDVGRLELSTLGVAEISRLLQSRETGTAQWAADRTFVNVMWQKSGGDPFYVNLLVKDIESGLIKSREDMEHQPSGLNDYLNKWWQEVGQITSDQAVRDLFGYLLVAKGRLTRDDLTSISEDDSLDDWVFDRTIKLLERYVVGAESEGYLLAHPRFQEFVTREKIKAAAQRPYRENLLAYCRRWQEHKSRYALNYYTSYLVERGSFAELHELLTTGDGKIEWAAARFESEGSHAGYLADLKLGWNAAADLGAEGLPLQVRYALIESTIRTLSINISADLMSELVPDIWAPAQALAYANAIPSEWQRSAALRAIMPRLDKKHRLDAVRSARDIANPKARIAALSEMCFFLTLADQRQLFHETAGIEDENERGTTIATLARGLSTELQLEAVEVASRIEDDFRRAAVLLEMAAYLPTAGQERVLMNLAELKNERLRAAALGRLVLKLPPPLNGAAVELLEDIQSEVIYAKAVMTWAREFPGDVLPEFVGSRLSDEIPPSDTGLVDFLLPTLPDGEMKQTLLDFRARLQFGLDAYAWEEPDEAAEATLRYVRAARDYLNSIMAMLSEETRAPVLDLTRMMAAKRRSIGYALIGIFDSLDERLHEDAVAAARSIRDLESRVRACTRVARTLNEAHCAALFREALAWTAEIVNENRRADALYGFYDCLPEGLRTGPWADKGGPGGEDRIAFVRWAVTNGWMEHRWLWAESGSEEPRGAFDILRQVAEYAPDDLKKRVLEVADRNDRDGPLPEAFGELAKQLQRVWLRAMRDEKKSDYFQDFPFISDDLIDLCAVDRPDAATNLQEKGQALDGLLDALGGNGLEQKALLRLVHSTPKPVRLQVIRETMAATRTIGGSAQNAKLCVKLVRHVNENLTAQVVKEALARIDAMENRELLSDYEKHLLELVYQAPAADLPEVLERVGLDPDPWVRARILCGASGPLLNSAQEQALTILCDISDNALEVALRLVAALDGDLQPRALSRARRVVDEQRRAEILADLTICLDAKLRNEVTEEALAIARRIDEDNRGWVLRVLARRLPEDARHEALSIAQQINDVSIRARSLGGIAASFAEPVRTEVVRETLRLLPAVPDVWKRISIIEDLAPALSGIMWEEAIAAVHALIEEEERPATLCKLADLMEEPRRREVYDEAVSIARRIENLQDRVLLLAKICQYLPSDQRAALAKEGWETMSEITSALQQQDDVEWRLSALTALLPHLPDDLAGDAALEAAQIVEEQPDSVRRRWVYPLRRALDQLKATATPVRQAGSKAENGQPRTLFQRDLNAIRLITRTHRDRTSATPAEVRECLEAIRSVYKQGDYLRQLIRCQTTGMSGEVTAELLGAVMTIDTEPLYIELSEHLTGVAKSSVLCEGLAVATHLPGREAFLGSALADVPQPGREGFLKMVAEWQEKRFDPDVGRSLFPSLLARAANRKRHELMDDLSAMVPLMAHLYGRGLVDATFKAFKDVTAWWP
jgi:Domain of unknown function (DUF4062)